MSLPKVRSVTASFGETPLAQGRCRVPEVAARQFQQPLWEARSAAPALLVAGRPAGLGPPHQRPRLSPHLEPGAPPPPPSSSAPPQPPPSGQVPAVAIHMPFPATLAFLGSPWPLSRMGYPRWQVAQGLEAWETHLPCLPRANESARLLREAQSRAGTAGQTQVRLPSSRAPSSPPPVLPPSSSPSSRAAPKPGLNLQPGATGRKQAPARGI